MADKLEREDHGFDFSLEDSWVWLCQHERKGTEGVERMETNRLIDWREMGATSLVPRFIGFYAILKRGMNREREIQNGKHACVRCLGFRGYAQSR
ncbi:hypothetical protein C1H46_025620 [Malus baccata]|uniref:Uncharacterized protein n=1 Tax=Malus baccata TaxID=106549 RepID=A0A540LQT3_MALBA|nr:hypothetical protein C1H46_025620 [Malus baccata]